MNGRVKSYDFSTGCGVIVADDGQEVGIEASDIVTPQNKMLCPGFSVAFQIEPGPSGARARKLVIIYRASEVQKSTSTQANGALGATTRRNGDSRVAIFVIAWILAVILGVCLYVWHSQRPTPPVKLTPEQAKKLQQEQAENARHELQTTLLVMAQSAVKGDLKAPSTADFPGLYSEYVFQDLGNDKWLVAGWVTANNAFGVPLRNRFLVTMQKDVSGQWTITKVTIVD